MAAVQMMVPLHYWPSSTSLCNDDGGGDGVEDSALVLPVVPPLLPCTTKPAAVVRMMVPCHHWRFVACLHNDNDNNGGNGMDDGALVSSAIPACLHNDDDGSNGGAAIGASASLAVPCLLMQGWRQW
jgi:hypothetical protein